MVRKYFTCLTYPSIVKGCGEGKTTHFGVLPGRQQATIANYTLIDYRMRLTVICCLHFVSVPAFCNQFNYRLR